MSEKRDSEVCRFQSFHAFVACRGRTPHDTGPRINDVPGAVHDDSSRRSRTVGIWQRRPSPEHDDLRLCRRRRLGEGCRMPREHKKQGDNCEHLTFASVTHAERSSCPAKPQELYLCFSSGCLPIGRVHQLRPSHETGAGRLLHHCFRGLLSVHLRYGLHARRVAFATLCTRGFSSLVASTAALIATGWSEPVPGRVYPRCGPAPSRRTRFARYPGTTRKVPLIRRQRKSVTSITLSAIFEK